MIQLKLKRETCLSINNGYEADTIEKKLEKVLTTNEPIDSTSPIIFTEKKNGVQAQYDIRTDRFEIAQDAMDYVHKSNIAKSKNKGEPIEGEQSVSGKPESAQDA